ncbi:MAG TPA: hypothetical protein VN192_04805 [Flavobacterium sp.]|nr:hypothetical protein [Flavobacterium sp.]
MKVGKTYRIKVLGRWINAVCCSDKSVKELFFRTKSGEIIMQYEIEEIK